MILPEPHCSAAVCVQPLKSTAVAVEKKILKHVQKFASFIRLFQLVGEKNSDFIIFLVYCTAVDCNESLSHTDTNWRWWRRRWVFILHYIPLQMDLKTFFTLCTEDNKKRMQKLDENGIICDTRAPREVSRIVVTRRPLEHQIGKCRWVEPRSSNNGLKKL